MLDVFSPQNIAQYLSVKHGMQQESISDSLLKKTKKRFNDLNDRTIIKSKVKHFIMTGQNKNVKEFIKLVDDPDIAIDKIIYNIVTNNTEEEELSMLEPIVFTITVFYYISNIPSTSKVITEFKSFTLPYEEKAMNNFLAKIQDEQVFKEYKNIFKTKKTIVHYVKDVYNRNGEVIYFYHVSHCLTDYIEGIIKPTVIPLGKEAKKDE